MLALGNDPDSPGMDVFVAPLTEKMWEHHRVGEGGCLQFLATETVRQLVCLFASYWLPLFVSSLRPCVAVRFRR